MSIVKYTSRGFVPAISTYSLARNHVFYNVVSSLIPGADSTPATPSPADFLCFRHRFAWAASRLRRETRVASARSRLRGACRGEFLCNGPRARSAGLWPDFPVRHARVAWLSPSGCALAERFGSTLWRSCVFWEPIRLPFCVVFAGGLLLVAFLYRPSRETFLAGLLSLAAILMLYLPIAGQVYAVFTGYRDRYRDTFHSPFESIEGVFSAFEYFLPSTLRRSALVLIAWLRCSMSLLRRFATRFDRSYSSQASQGRFWVSWHSVFTARRFPLGLRSPWPRRSRS